MVDNDICINIHIYLQIHMGGRDSFFKTPKPFKHTVFTGFSFGKLREYSQADQTGCFIFVGK